MSTDTPRTQIRQDFAERIRHAAKHALDHPSDEPAERLRILGMLLDPELGLIERCIRSYERGDQFPTTERDDIVSYLSRQFERKVIGTADKNADGVIGLSGFVDGDALSWAYKFGRGCVQNGVKEVQRNRGRYFTSAPSSSALAFSQVMSAEDSFLLREHEDLADTILAIVETWDARQLSTHERQQELSKYLLKLRYLPELFVRGNSERRWLASTITGPKSMPLIRGALAAFIDLASGEPSWDQMAVDDRLLDLWLNFTVEQANVLASLDERELWSIINGAIAFPPRPSEAQRVAVRRITKGLTKTAGWPSVVMDLERAWVAEHFTARAEMDRKGKLTEEEAESARQDDAAGWRDVAELALSFPGKPLGPQIRSPQDVSTWMFQALTIASTS